MKRLKRASELSADARRRNLAQLAALGGDVREARKRRRWTQARLAGAAGVSRSAVSAIERGLGGGQSLDTWQRIGLAAGRPLLVKLQRDVLEDVRDAGHLAIQELVLRLARRTGRKRSFELATRPTEPWRSTDAGIRDDTHRVLINVECWNTIGDVGAAARATSRKLAEADQLAAAAGGDKPYRVASCWLVRDTRRNRAIVQRYPEVFAARFPGSSRAWVATLVDGTEPPLEPGLVWSPTDATRVFAWRRR